MIARERTAIRRNDLSRPMRLAVRDGMVTPNSELLDYGCGHGDDVRNLLCIGIRASGWDPAHRPEAERRDADVVNLGYVVNVVENPLERADCLRSAWTFARHLMVVSARLNSDLDLRTGESFEDGFVTRLRTFQKFFEQHELRDWIQEVLGVMPVAAAPGVFYVFRNDADRESFAASRYQRKIAAPKIRLSDRLFEEHQAELRPLVDCVVARGRLPEPDEVDSGSYLTSIFGSIKRAFLVVKRVTGEEQWQAITDERRTDLLVYLALGRFPRRPAFATLPQMLQRDIKALFKTYKAASIAGDALLYEAGNLAKVNEACTSSAFGKLLPTALYVHVGSIGRLAPVLRVYEGCARVLSGDVEGATIIKLRRNEPKVSYLGYPSFETEAHPALTFSVRVDLRALNIRQLDFQDAANPPILHRKEEFVPEDYPSRDTFAALTKAEEAQGLYADTSAIGTRDGWNRVLAAKGIRLEGNNLIFT